MDFKLTSDRPLSGSQSPEACVSLPESSSWFPSQFAFCLAAALPAGGKTRFLGVWGTWGLQTCGCICLTLARNPPKWAPMLESTFFFLASSSALFLASSSSFLCLSSWGSNLQLVTALSLIWIAFSIVCGVMILWSKQIIDVHGLNSIRYTTLITAIRVCLSRSFSALTRCCSALSARRLSYNTESVPAGLLQTAFEALLFWIFNVSPFQTNTFENGIEKGFTILSLSPMSSSSSFFLCSKWTSIRVCSSRRSFSILFLWIS